MSRDFLLLVFFMNQLPPSPWVYHYGRFEFFRKFAEIFAAQGQFAAGVAEKIRNGPNGILWGWGETDSWKNQKQNISWHCPFKYSNSNNQVFCTGKIKRNKKLSHLVLCECCGEDGFAQQLWRGPAVQLLHFHWHLTQYVIKQCYGSGSGIRCLFDPWIRDG